MFCFLIHLPTDQLNTTKHGVMKTTPYELVFGQSPRQNRDKSPDSDDKNQVRMGIRRLKTRNLLNKEI